MRVELEFDLAQPTISRDYRRIVLSWLKTALTNCNNGKYYDRYFGGIQSKDYSFAVVFPSPFFSKENILLEEPRLKIIFSADDRNKTGLIFFSAFLGMKNQRFPLQNGNRMVLRRISQRSEQLIVEPDVYFRTCPGNGLCIRVHDRDSNRDRYVTYEDNDFRERTVEVLKTQANLAGYPRFMTEDLDIEPIQCKKVLVYHYQIYIDTTVGVFKMHGNPDLLQYFYAAGIGSRHSCGFGMVSVLKQGGDGKCVMRCEE